MNDPIENAAAEDSQTTDSPAVGCRALVLPGIWFIRGFSAQWGSRYMEAAQHYAAAYKSLPEDLRPECLAIAGDDLNTQMAVDALMSAGLPAVRMYLGIRTDDEPDVMTHPAIQFLRGMNDLQNPESGCLRISGWQCPTLNKVANGESWKWSLGIERPDLEIVASVTECVSDGIREELHSDCLDVVYGCAEQNDSSAATSRKNPMQTNHEKPTGGELAAAPLFCLDCVAEVIGASLPLCEQESRPTPTPEATPRHTSRLVEGSPQTESEACVACGYSSSPAAHLEELRQPPAEPHNSGATTPAPDGSKSGATPADPEVHTCAKSGKRTIRELEAFLDCSGILQNPLPTLSQCNRDGYIVVPPAFGIGVTGLIGQNDSALRPMAENLQHPNNENRPQASNSEQRLVLPCCGAEAGPHKEAKFCWWCGASLTEVPVFAPAVHSIGEGLQGGLSELGIECGVVTGNLNGSYTHLMLQFAAWSVSVAVAGTPQNPKTSVSLFKGWRFGKPPIKRNELTETENVGILREHTEVSGHLNQGSIGG